MLPGCASVPSPSSLSLWAWSQPDGLGFWWPPAWAPVGDESRTASVDLCVKVFCTHQCWSFLSASVCTAQSKKDRLSPLTSPPVNLMLLSTAFMCSVKAYRSLLLIVTQVSSKYLNHGLGALPVKAIKAINLFHVEVGHYWGHRWAHMCKVEVLKQIKSPYNSNFFFSVIKKLIYFDNVGDALSPTSRDFNLTHWTLRVRNTVSRCTRRKVCQSGEF